MKYIYLSLSFFLIWLIYSRVFFGSMLIGEYSFEFNYCDNFLVDSPNRNDNLLILKNSKFRSFYWGSGEYRIEYGLLKTKIIFITSGGTAEFEAEIRRKGISKTIIIVNDLCNHYYEKIK